MEWGWNLVRAYQYSLKVFRLRFDLRITSRHEFREDRDISGKAITDLKARLKAFSIPVKVVGHRHAVLKLMKVPTCTGTVTVVFSRGKVRIPICRLWDMYSIFFCPQIRPGYELTLTATWQLEGADGAVIGKGKVACEELEDVDVGEHELLVSCGVASDANRRAVTGCVGAINGVIAEWFEALKAM
jgi:hypothetical protein